MAKYSSDEIQTQLQTVKGWLYNGKSIEKNFTFRDFNETFSFMCRVAMLAEKANHHPDWQGGYNHLTIQLHSHDAGGLTERDFKLAAQIDTIAGI